MAPLTSEPRSERIGRPLAARARARTLVGATLAAALALVALPLVPLRASAQQEPPAASAPPEQALRTLLAGRYVPAPGAPNAANRDAAVARAVDALLFLIRPIASGRLTEVNPVFASVTVSFPDGMIEVQMPPLVARSPDNGAEGSMLSLSRERNRLVQRLTHDALLQRSWSDQGSRTTRFLPGGNGRLILQIEMASPRLPVPVRYTLAYQRS